MKSSQAAQHINESTKSPKLRRAFVQGPQSQPTKGFTVSEEVFDSFQIIFVVKYPAIFRLGSVQYNSNFPCHWNSPFRCKKIRKRIEKIYDLKLRHIFNSSKKSHLNAFIYTKSRFLAKTLRVNKKFPWKYFSKSQSFGVDVKL